jgi:hypothetical protein
MFKIEKGIPLPDARSGTRSPDAVPYPFDKMKVGDSFFIPTKGPVQMRRQTMRRVLAASYKFRRKTKSAASFASRSFSDGVRIWRVA